MEYTIKQLAELAGITTRTLRHYDQIGLLRPDRVSQTGYRIYGPTQVELLQQILFYRQRGLELSKIREIIYGESFDILQALQEHLCALQQEKEKLERMIFTVEETIAVMRGEETMSDKEKFQCFKEELVGENEAKYGKEIREKYGDAEVDAANRKFMQMSEEEYQYFEELGSRIQKKLEAAVKAGESPAGSAGIEISQMHKEWLLMTWAAEQYTPQAHKGLVQMYVLDPRFTAFYDRNVKGCARFLQDAVKVNL